MKPEVISSNQNPRVKNIMKLHQSQKSKLRGQILLESPQLLAIALEHGFAIEELYFTKAFLERNPSWQQRNLNYAIMTEQVLKKAANMVSPPGILAVIKRPQYSFAEVIAGQRLLILDQIKDAGNMGTILRTAKALGIDGCLLTPMTTDPYSLKAIRSSAGYNLTLPLWESRDLNQFILNLKQLPHQLVLASSRDGQTISAQQLTQKWALILSSESHGESSFWQEFNYQKISIPLAQGVESLNVAIAGAILLFHLIYKKERV